MTQGYVSIQENLSKFYTKWKSYEKNERKGYQTFMTDFFACFGVTFDDPNTLPFEENTGDGFADALIEDVVIFEMKDRKKVKTRKELEAQLPQALRYWEGKGKHVPFLVLCNFSDFVVFDTRDQSMHHIKLGELDAKLESFVFLVRLNPTFAPEQEAVSKKSARLMGALYKSLRKRFKGHDEEVDLFVLQCLFCLFSEDIGYLPSQTFTSCVRRIKDGEDNSANILSTLFKMMDERDSNRKKGKFQNVLYFNGPLFRKRPEIVLEDNEVDLLWESCQLDWRNVRPEIFGALFESTQTKQARHKDGMHFTSEDDIMKVIRPCIVQPWEERLADCKSLSDFRKLHDQLKAYRVLDPACGSGNFLIVAYRELKRIEERIFIECKKLSGDSYIKVQQTMEWFPVTNMHGMELNSFPSFLTKVSLWITKKIIRNELKLTEPDLPLEELKHIISADALEMRWDDVDVVVGNPPYIGCKKIRNERGDEYFKWLGKRFPDHNQMSDYCTYWFEKVSEDVRPGVRVGLVCTKTISQTNSRVASLDKVVSNGGTIFNAISNQKWSGEAKVHVSIVNFINRGSYEGRKCLDGKSIAEISSRLKTQISEYEPVCLKENSEKAFVGVMPNGKGFILNDEKRIELTRKNKKNSSVIKRFLNGEDINHNHDQSPSRWIIDFENWALEKAMGFKESLDHVRKTVKPVRDKVRRERHAQNWWRYGEERTGMRKAIEKLDRFVAVSRVSKYPIFVFYSNSDILVGDSTVLIAFDDYSRLGVLQSRFHTDWYTYQCSSLKSDPRYTNTTVFETFPFPENISKEVGSTMERIDKLRKKICSTSNIGLTNLYNQLQEGAHQELKMLHSELDRAVAKSYGFPPSKIDSNSDVIKFLLDRNQKLAVAQDIEKAIQKGAVKKVRRRS